MGVAGPAADGDRGATRVGATGVYLAQPYGPLFCFHSAYAYVLLLVGTALFVTTAGETTGTHRAQAAGLPGVAAVPWLANVGYLLGLFPVGFDPTPLGFVASALLLGTPLGDALPDLAAVANASVDDRERPTYVRSGSGCDRSYDVRVSRFSRGGLLGGRIVTLRDVTERRRHERRLSVLNRVLRHDLRNDINVVVGYANLLDPAADDDDADLRPVERVRERADEMLALTEKVRDAEAGLDRRESTVTTVDLGGVLRDVVSTASADFPEATVRLDAPERVPVRGTEFLDSVFDNLVENALEHASGFGLWLVTWLVEESGGAVGFEADDAGTTVDVHLPTAGTEAGLAGE